MGVLFVISVFVLQFPVPVLQVLCVVVWGSQEVVVLRRPQRESPLSGDRPGRPQTLYFCYSIPYCCCRFTNGQQSQIFTLFSPSLLSLWRKSYLGNYGAVTCLWPPRCSLAGGKSLGEFSYVLCLH